MPRPCPSAPSCGVPRHVEPEDRDPTAVAFGQAIRRARQARNETLETVAARIPRRNRRGQTIAMDGRHLGEIERGYHSPSISTARQIAHALDATLADLVREL